MATQTLEQTASTPWTNIFAARSSKRTQIRTAVSLLQKLLGRPAGPDIADAWAMMLERFSGEQLALAFDKVAMSSKNWPTTGDICEAIFEDEFTADLAFLLAGLRRHKSDWADIPVSRGPSTLGATINDIIPGPIIAGIPAPKIPNRLILALKLFGGTGMMAGLERLYTHPSVSPSAHGEPVWFIEAQFHKAWLQARKAELGGAICR
jgi:hypothetical protein